MKEIKDLNLPEDVRYSKDHEWARMEGDTAKIGITDYAQDTLGDIVYIELPEVGREVKTGEEITTIESVKAAEPIFAPLSGKIVDANAALNDSPEQINQNPFGSPIFVLEMADPNEAGELLDHRGYLKVVEESQAED